jgi:hypothetical protein
MIDIFSFLPSSRKQTSSGWVSFNAPCCVYNGNSQDKRKRGGVKINDDGWSYHCFNCGYTASFILGRNLSIKARNFLTWINVPQEEIDRINLESMRHRSMDGVLYDREKRQVADQLAGVRFKEFPLPKDSMLLDEEEHPMQFAYILHRNAPTNYPYMIRSSDGVHWTRPHVMIPFTYDNVIVGSTTRFIDGKQPVWINDFQSGYVFGTDLQKHSWRYVIVTEGIFDALSIDGLALMHNTVNEGQARLIRNIGKEIIVVPDQDKAGLELIDRAVELRWAVSIPIWPEGIKDVNDAVCKLGKVATLLTILQAKETSKIKIEIRKQQLVKRLRN